MEALDAELVADRDAGERLAVELRACAQREAEVQTRLKACGEDVTRTRSPRSGRATPTTTREEELERLGALASAGGRAGGRPLEDGARAELEGRIERLRRRREQLGPVNPLAQAEYAEAVAHVEELEAQREDLETAMRELEQLIRDTDRRIQDAFEETFAAAAQAFEEVVGAPLPGRPRAAAARARGRRAAPGAGRRRRGAARSRGRRPPAATSGSRSSSRRPARPPSGCRCCRAARSR